MSRLIVEVCEILDVIPHQNADRLEKLIIKGWQVIAQKDFCKKGDKVIYFPPDSVMSHSLSEKLGITKYLSQVPTLPDEEPRYRVKAARLRGEPSFGTIMECEDPSWPIGFDVKNIYNITKHELIVNLDGDAEKPHESFHHYTEIENIRNFPDILQEGEEVIFSEKIHGSNFRVGLIREDDKQTWMVGSHNVRRKEFNQKGVKSHFWDTLTENMQDMLMELAYVDADTKQDVIVFGEIFGQSVQDMNYGRLKKDFRVFDISINHIYMNFDDKVAICNKFQIPMVPILYCGPFDWQVMEEYTSGNTTLCEPNEAGRFKGREGIVITPTTERTNSTVGRVILKSINPDYLDRKGGTDNA